MAERLEGLSPTDASRRPYGVDRSKRRSVWLAATALLVIGGLLGSLFAAGSVRSNDTARSQEAFKASSGTITSTLQLAIQHESDLNVSAAGFIVGDPTASSVEFDQWAGSVRALARYPELVGMSYLVMVSSAELPAFAARSVAHQVGPLASKGPFEVTPPGSRSFYCFLVASVSVGKQTTLPGGSDFCPPGPDRTAELAAEDSGQGAYLPYQIGKTAVLAILTPVYRGGLTPLTVDGRQAAFLGWIGMAVLPQVVLSRALQGQPGTAVTFVYHVGSSNAVFHSGQAPPGAQTATINLNNGWTVTTSGAHIPAGVFGNSNAIEVFVAGVLLSVLLGLLVFVLGTGRARALRTVSEKTGELRHQALHDALTGLPNRALIMDRIEQLLARNRRHGTMGAALYVDLDEFKNVNDSLGHEIGDQLLTAVTARLETTLRDADTIGRMGGDEFIVLIDGSTMNVGPELVAERLLEVLRRPFELAGTTTPLVVKASIGIAIGDRETPGDLLRDADVALYQAKAAGRNRYEIFQPEMQLEIQQRIDLEFDMRSALDNNQFRLVYQPIYDLDDLTLVAVEALLRWDNPTRGLIQPDEFIPILEQTGHIREVGRWVLRQACEQTAAWHARGDILDVSVNISGRQLDDDAIIEHIHEALAQSGLDATSLIIEVTETALMRNVEATAQRLRAIKDLGVRIAIDDFGTGYSSLAYLRQFPVDCLKIDRSFTNAISASLESKAIIATLVQLGKDLGLMTLAEGVETTEQMDHLRQEHVNQAQGFLLARPLDPATIEAQILAPLRPTTTTANRP
jgi:diguanylate cyclase (GGDEF)-like protein